MARFSAVTSDDSDSDEIEYLEKEDERVLTPVQEQEHDADEEEESDSGSSTSDSDMHEDDLLPRADQSDDSEEDEEDEENDDDDVIEVQDDEDEDHEQERMHPEPFVGSSSRSIPPSAKNRPDNSIIPWAQQIGVNPQKMHVMQTSLFRMPEEAAALKAVDQPMRSRRFMARTLNRKHSRESDGDAARFESRERASFAHDIEPLPYRPSRKYARVETSASAVRGNENSLADAGLALGRSFRASWGPRSLLVHLGEVCGPSSSISSSANSSVVKITGIPTLSRVDDPAEKMSKLLQHHLSHSPIEPDEAGLPFANPSSDLRFSSFVSLWPLSDRSYEATLFRLGHALFDEVDLKLADSITIDIRRRVETIRRKAALSAWLEKTVAPTVEAELRQHPTTGSPAVAFTLLTGNQVEKACERTIDGGNVKLATLISQASGDADFKDDLRSQLQIWREQRIDAHIDENIRKIYALLAGIVDVVPGSKGTGIERCEDIDIANGLDWKRTFGLHLWFSQPQDASIADVYQSYTRHWKESPHRVTPPHPTHAKRTTNVPPDALSSLIRLYAEPACSLSQILIPTSFGPSPTDYSLPWHLYILLSRCMRIRDLADRGEPGVDSDTQDGGDDNARVEGHSPSADLLASGYAFQLERLGMIQEAAFVLLHIEGSAGREKAIKDLLFRSAARLDEWMTRGIVGSLKIPIAWVNEAKAIHAFSQDRVWEAYELYMEADLFNSAHELAVLELAPDAILRRDLRLLKSLFVKIAGHPVDGWHVRGKAFLDYAHIMTRVPELHGRMQEEENAVPDASEAMELAELVRQIPKLIGILPDVLRDRTDPRHSAALAVMISGLMLHLDRIQPLSLTRPQVQLSVADDATKLRHIRSVARERFLQAIEVA